MRARLGVAVLCVLFCLALVVATACDRRPPGVPPDCWIHNQNEVQCP